jgi:hypothetical protein
MLDLDPPTFLSLAPVPELRQIVESSWGTLTPWMKQLDDLELLGDEDWPRDLIARADTRVGRPIADVAVHLEVLPVIGLRHWTLTEDPTRHLLHALITADIAVEPRSHDQWLVDALNRIG